MGGNLKSKAFFDFEILEACIKKIESTIDTLSKPLERKKQIKKLGEISQSTLPLSASRIEPLRTRLFQKSSTATSYMPSTSFAPMYGHGQAGQAPYYNPQSSNAFMPNAMANSA